MNIIDAYLGFKGQFVVAISGISGCGKTSMTKKISDDLNMIHFNQFDYYKSDYDDKVSLPSGLEIINWYNDDAVDWERFNNDITDSIKNKKQGIIISAFSLPNDNITFTIDFHIHLSIAKKACIEQRRKFLEKHKDRYPEQYEMISTDSDKLEMNQLIYPYYLETVKKMTINKFVNMNVLTAQEVYDTIWDLIIDHVQSYIDKFHKSESYLEWKKKQMDKKEYKNDSVKSEMNTSELVGKSSEIESIDESSIITTLDYSLSKTRPTKSKKKRVKKVQSRSK